MLMGLVSINHLRAKWGTNPINSTLKYSWCWPRLERPPVPSIPLPSTSIMSFWSQFCSNWRERVPFVRLDQPESVCFSGRSSACCTLLYDNCRRLTATAGGLTVEGEQWLAHLFLQSWGQGSGQDGGKDSEQEKALWERCLWKRLSLPGVVGGN